jgi:hypothetical protein
VTKVPFFLHNRCGRWSVLGGKATTRVACQNTGNEILRDCDVAAVKKRPDAPGWIFMAEITTRGAHRLADMRFNRSAWWLL